MRKKRKEKKDWNKAAEKFASISKQDEYLESLMSKMNVGKKDSVLDLGCGEGSITIPIAKKVAKVTAIDSSQKMLEILEKRCVDEKIANVEIVQKDLEDLSNEDIKSHDVALSSRSLNGIWNIKDTVLKLNEIANKYVYITLFGPKNWKFEKNFYESINKSYDEFASYSYLFNLLVSLEIYPNVENLEIETGRTYESVYEAMNNGRWKLDTFTDDEKNKLRSYLKENLVENKEGKLENPVDRADWVLIWWKKE